MLYIFQFSSPRGSNGVSSSVDSGVDASTATYDKDAIPRDATSDEDAIFVDATSSREKYAVENASSSGFAVSPNPLPSDLLHQPSSSSISFNTDFPSTTGGFAEATTQQNNQDDQNNREDDENGLDDRTPSLNIRYRSNVKSTEEGEGDFHGEENGNRLMEQSISKDNQAESEPIRPTSSFSSTNQSDGELDVTLYRLAPSETPSASSSSSSLTSLGDNESDVVTLYSLADPMPPKTNDATSDEKRVYVGPFVRGGKSYKGYSYVRKGLCRNF